MNQTSAIAQPSTAFKSIFNIFLSLALAALLFYLIGLGVEFVRDEEAPQRLFIGIYESLGMEQEAQNFLDEGVNPIVNKMIIALVAITIGIGGIWALFWVADNFVSQLPLKIKERVGHYVFIGPAIILLAFFLVYPTFNTIYTSFTEDILKIPDSIPEELFGVDDVLYELTAVGKNMVFDRYLLNGEQFEAAKLTVINTKDETKNRTVWLFQTGDKISTFGLKNYVFAFTSNDMKIAFRNNLLWLVIGTGGSVLLGLLVATLVDRIKREALAKTFIFMPLAISLVGASVIWRFVYAWQPPMREQTGVLNAIVTFFGNDPIPWIMEKPINTYALIVIMVWLQTGFCMVVLSAALKGVPNEVLESARIDGANEFQLFFRVIVPMIQGSIVTVSTTVFIAILKVFDIVYVMTSGNHETEVIANRMFVEMFQFFNFGNASALAVILLIVVIPIMALNIRNLRRQGINQ